MAKKKGEESERIPDDAAEEDKVSVDLDEVEAREAEEAEDTEQEAAPESSSRRRGRQHREMEERLAASEKRYEEAAARTAQLEGHVRQLYDRPAAKPTEADEDPSERELENLYEEQKLLVTRLEIDKNISREELQTLEKRARKLDLRKQEIVAERVAKRHMPRQQEQMHPVRAQLEAEYADVYSNQRAQAWAANYAGMKVASGEREAGLSLAKEALDQARRQFKMRSASPESSDGVKARMSGVPARSNAGGAGKRPVVLGKVHQGMAEAMYDKLTPAKAYEKWAKGPGKKMLDGE